MQDYDELDLLDDDGDGVVEMCLIEEEEKQIKKTKESKIGCSMVLFLIGLFIILAFMLFLSSPDIRLMICGL